MSHERSRYLVWCLAGALALSACEKAPETGPGTYGTGGAGTGGKATPSCGPDWRGDGGAPACPTGGAGGGGGGAGTATGGSGLGGGGGGATCSCTQSTAPTEPVVFSWDCFCDTQPQACAGTLDDALAAARANTSLCYARATYADCGLTALYSVYGLFGGWSMTAFDAVTSRPAGVIQRTDTPFFGCPGEARVSFSQAAGRLPDCSATTCEVFGNCATTLPPPCAAK